MLQLLVLFSFLLLCCLGEERPLIETSLGKIKGHHKRSYGGRTFAAFEGIPYAKPPIDNLRFQDPQSVEPWSGIWDATLQHECMQLNWMNFDSMGSEDCLYLNVYVPKKQPVPNENLDVVVFFHGGAFMLGSASMGGPEYLMDRDIVYVSLNYRLGVMGFLSTEDGVVPGNMGMKDQVLALQWVQNHIHHFGGNPKSVTIIGISAGSASVHLHYFSPLTKGLFHRGISQSGTALAPWVIQDAPLEMARKLGATIGCDNPCPKEFVKCLRERPAKQVIKNSYSLSPYLLFPIAPFSPVIETKSENAFLTESPYELLSRGDYTKVPWITSATTDEGMLIFMLLRENFNLLDNEWEKMLPYFLDYNHTVYESDKEAVQKRIKKFYFGDNDLLSNDIKNVVKLVGDRYFNFDIEKSARLQAKAYDSPVYSYIYGYKAEHDFMGGLFGEQKYKGVSHGEDAYLLYQSMFGGFSFKVDKLSKSDEKIKNLFVDMVTSFAKNGKPKIDGIEWDAVKDVGDFPFLSIHNDGIKLDSKKELAPTEFWNSLPINENENIVSIKDEL